MEEILMGMQQFLFALIREAAFEANSKFPDYRDPAFTILPFKERMKIMDAHGGRVQLLNLVIY